ncbi:Cdc15p [Rhizophagus irregularis DAOM 197198w]|uniref:Cdc15p n=1 Tax=Rhizophagus irregularis (strain DAOM 197198w) TaxID=1432141 RepID=A0A015ITA0_RHIIW|nr:Cdc15p [Rhizophagus irregularis DAOM 197198w]
MELVNTNDEIFFDPTPRLKSSPIPIKFICFNKNDINCIYCGEKYIVTLFYWNQKYCEKCLSRYINDITDNKIYLDIHYTELECNKHKISKTKVRRSIQECCRNYINIVCFKQIYYFGNYSLNLYNKVMESEKHCILCGKSLGKITACARQSILCSDCYRISFECVKSTLVKKQILILYLPWWLNISECNMCSSELTFTSDCQKNCKNCLISYIGCRYCLTTNIIFGLTGQTHCKKCKRISLIINSNIDSYLIDFFLNDIIFHNLKDYDNIANIVNSIDKYFETETLLYCIFEEKDRVKPVKWIPYSQFKDVKEMTKGGYGIIYKATWLSYNETVILKRFENSKNNNKYFLNELRSNQQCFNKFGNHIITTYGCTKDPELDDYILIMKYASEGDLHKYLQKNFTNLTWNNNIVRYNKLNILSDISKGLKYIHNNKFIHRDIHSGNILSDPSWKIGDLGLSQSVNNESSDNEIYGVIPYIAPEIFKGSSFSKKADIYSLGMIMWEITTGCKPFANVKHDIHLIYKILDGERPKITDDTPKCYANLMKSCWDPDPKKRPSMKEIYLTVNDWCFNSKNDAEFKQAEAKREKLVESKKIGPEFAEKCHPEAIYTSRPLSDLISKCSSINSFSTISFGNKQGITRK